MPLLARTDCKVEANQAGFKRLKEISSVELQNQLGDMLKINMAK